MRKLSSLSIFFPSLDDGKILPYLVAKADWAARQVTSDFEIIIIDNGSTDETLAALKILQKQYSHLRIFCFKNPLGYGGALQEGFSHSKKEWVFYTDGDGQYDPLELVKLVKKLNQDIDVVNGYKIKRSDSWYREIIGKIYNNFLHAKYHLPVKDIDCDFRLIRRSFLNKICLESRSGVICLELVLKLAEAGAKFAEVGVVHHKRVFGNSKFFHLSHLWPTVCDLLKF